MGLSSSSGRSRHFQHRSRSTCLIPETWSSRASCFREMPSSARKKSVLAQEAVGRIAAEQLTPYPPGIPVVVPGEQINEAVIDYLRSGLAAGMVVPDATDQTLETFLVVTDGLQQA